MQIASRAARERRKGLAGIVAAALLFAMLFSTGTAYFLFVNAQNQAYSQTLVARANSLASRMNEVFSITATQTNAYKSYSGVYLGFTVQNTGQLALTIGSVFVLSSSGAILGVYGTQFSNNTTPALSIGVNPGFTSTTIGTGIHYVTPNEYYIKVVTQRGNVQTVEYPPIVQNLNILQAQASGSLTVNMATFKWLNVSTAASVSNYAYTSNCASSSCGLGFGSGNSVTSGDVLVYSVDWLNQNPPATVPTDTRGTSFTLGVSSSVTSTAQESIVQSIYGTCSSSTSCAPQLKSAASIGDILVVGISSTTSVSSSTPVSDTQGNTFTQGASKTNTYYSYMYYATVTSSGSGADTITVKFSASASASVSVYEVAGATTTGIISSTNSGSSTSPTAGQLSPVSDSIVIANVASVLAKDTAGSGYTLASTTCNTASSYGCSESELTSSPTNPPFTLSGSGGAWAEVAVALGPATYYSYIWYGTAPSTGSDTITATFSSTVVGAVSIYDISGASTTGIVTATGSSAPGSASLSTSPLTPGPSQLVIAAAMKGYAPPSFTAGTGYTLINNCNAALGCSESGTGLTSSTNAPFTLSSSEPWAEAAISFGPGSQQVQTGGLVNGFSAISIPSSCNWQYWQCTSSPIIFRINFTNADALGRTVTIWPQSALSIVTAQSGTGHWWWTQIATAFYLVQGPNSATYPTGVIAYSGNPANFITLPVGKSVALYFAATQAEGSNINNINNYWSSYSRNGPFEAVFAITGEYSDDTPFGQTVPFPSGVVTGAHADLSTYSGITNSQITLTGSNFNPSTTGEIGWMGSNNGIAPIGTFTTDANGNINTSFTVPSAAPGYYTVVVTDYLNTYFLVFYHS